MGEDSAQGMLSLHELSVVPALQLDAIAGRVFSDVTIFGVEPAVVEWGEGLSPAVADAVERLVDKVLAHVKNKPAPGPIAARSVPLGKPAGGSPRRDVS